MGLTARLLAGATLLLSTQAVPVEQAANDTILQPVHHHGNNFVLPPPTGPIFRHGGSNGHHYHGPAWLPHGQDTKGRLSQWRTNGHSNLGTFHAPHLPHWLHNSNEPMPHGRPWGDKSADHSNPYKECPNTGVTRHYDFTVGEMIIAPDGVEKKGLVINEAFPGPTIEANWGDWIEVVVHNNLTWEGTSLHWHGLLQRETPWFDGVPSLSQCPIAPGSSFTYRFRADLYGSSWYHSHYSAQYAGGALGAMIIHGPQNADYDIDLGPVLLTDWYHDDYFDLLEEVMAPAAEGLTPPLSNNNLINGKGNYPCANATEGVSCTSNAGIAKFKFETGKKHRMRFINGGAEGIQKVSIDGYKMTIIANDFVPVEPYEMDHVTLGVGQRTDVIVEAIGKSTDAVWLRSNLGHSAFEGGCTLHDGVSPEAVAAIYYPDADDSAVPTTTSTLTDEQIDYCGNDDLATTQPMFPITPDPNPETVQVVDITYESNGTHNLFYMNNSTFRADYNDPLLLEAKLGREEFDPFANVYDFGDAKSVRMVLYNHGLQGAHPMHIHGHNMFVLAEGFGEWDGTVANPENPQRRDTHILHNAKDSDTPAFMVLQFETDNPGVWPMHCHIAWHVSAGLYLNVLERGEDIRNGMNLPGIMGQTCRDWSTWSGQEVVPQIDSGL
ncbi:hypothetical protein MBLNU230_g2095t1 [Neophaeotheca triangularis]